MSGCLFFGALFIPFFVFRLLIETAIDWINKAITEKKNKTEKEEV